MLKRHYYNWEQKLVQRTNDPAEQPQNVDLPIGW